MIVNAIVQVNTQDVATIRWDNESGRLSYISPMAGRPPIKNGQKVTIRSGREICEATVVIAPHYFRMIEITQISDC